MTARKTVTYFLATALVAICFCPQASAQDNKKVAYGILIDNTGSLRSQFDIVIEVSKGIVEQTYQQGPISLFPFMTSGKGANGLALISSDVQWSQEKDDLEGFLDSLYVVPGQTRLMDGISKIADDLNAKANEDKDAFSQKVIFLITDGEDRSSNITEKNLIKLLKESGIQVFAVGLVNELDNDQGFIRRDVKGKSMSFLEKITKETGGRVVFANSKRDEPKSLLKRLFEKKTEKN